MATKYTYSIQDDFPNHKVASDRLAREIQTSAITIAFDYIGTAGDDCDVWFKADLPSGDETILDGLVAAHSGDPLPSEAQPVLIDPTQTPVPVASKSSSGWFPDPAAYTLGSIPSVVDYGGSQQIRGPVLTDEGSFKDDFSGSSLDSSITGTLTFTNGSRTVTGSGTAFRSELTVNHYVRLSADSSLSATCVESVDSDTEMTLDSEYQGTGGTGAAVKSKWVHNTSGGSIEVGTSKIILKSGTTAGAFSTINRAIDTLPLRVTAIVSYSQRLATQGASFGLLDTPNGPPYNDMVAVHFDGTDSKHIKFVTSCGGTTEESLIDLSSELTTDKELFYAFELSYFTSSLFVNRVLVATHERHIPEHYTNLYFGIIIWNTATSDEGLLSIDSVVVSNHDQIQIGGAFMQGEPIPTRIVENCFTLAGALTTTSTEADQTILAYTVPTGKMLYATGYSISGADNSVDGNPVKIGRNDLSTIPQAPGKIGGNFLRVFRLKSNAREMGDWSANPRLLGVGGDTIKVLVTPNGSLETEWHATLDFILR